MPRFLTSLFSFDSLRPLLFTQLDFWVFFFLVLALLAAVLALQNLAGKANPNKRPRQTFRNAYLALVSLLFYYKTSGLFVLLLVLASLTGWLLGIALDRWRALPLAAHYSSSA